MTILLAAQVLHAQAPVGTAFSYQGRLNAAGAPATGNYDLKFELYDADADGHLIGAAVERLGVAVANGLFTTELDFGGPATFDGTGYWLNISVKTAGGPEYTALAPRQPLRPVPYAIRAQSAATVAAGGVTSATGAPDTGMVLGFDGANLTWLTPTGGTGGGGSLTLPFNGLKSSPGALFSVNNMNATGDPWAICGHRQIRLGVFGQPHGNSTGVLGRADGAGGSAVFGYSSGAAVGVLAISEGHDGISACTNADNRSASYAYTVWNSAGGEAIRTDGTVRVGGRTITKTLEITGGADLAEPFAMTDSAGIPKGSVVVIDDERPGDLLTTSDTPGHAMKVTDPDRACGAILGKAMGRLARGEKGHVLVLVTLQ